MSELGSQLRKIRQERKLSLRAVEEATGISNAYLSQLERGQVKTPSPQKLEALADHYGVPYERLLQLAGYLKGKEVDVSTSENSAGNNRSPKRPSLLLSAIEDANLTAEDEKLAAEYISFLCSRNSSKP